METISERKNFVFLLWEMERVLIRNMKHYDIMKLLNCSKFVLNFVSSRAIAIISLYLVSKNRLPSASE